MSEYKKYCEGLDCTICGEKEPCIYKIANKLQAQLQAKEQECESQKQRLEYYRKKTTQLLDDIDNKDRFNTELQEENEEQKARIKELLHNCNSCKFHQYKQALDEIEKIANKQRKFDLTGKTPLTPVINEVGGDFIDILDIINKAKEQ